jgi:formylglycine-generating enzyme required for sulfatase activity
MVYVPGGSFEMGAGNTQPDGPAHTVRLSQAYFIDVLEATAKDYEACVAAGGCTPASVHGPYVPAAAVEYEPLCNRSKNGRGNHPANCVDLEQAKSFCIHNGKRLLTETEWEYAARGVDRRTYPWGNDVPSTCDLAVTGACQATGTAKVGSRIASSVSAMGALDMAGNVGEWVEDSWDAAAYQAAPPVDPMVNAASTIGVLRGGSWDLPPSMATTTSRQQFDKREGHVNTGIRCARSAS